MLPPSDPLLLASATCRSFSVVSRRNVGLLASAAASAVADEEPAPANGWADDEGAISSGFVLVLLRRLRWTEFARETGADAQGSSSTGDVTMAAEGEVTDGILTLYCLA